MPTSTYSIKIRNRALYRNRYGASEPIDRRSAWHLSKQVYAEKFPASIIIDERIAIVGPTGFVFLSDEVDEWLMENCFPHYHVNEIAMMIGFVDEEDALAFQIRFLG